MPESNDNEAQKERVLKAKTMVEIMEEALDLQESLENSDISVVRAAERDLQKLVDRFYHENQDLMAPGQYEAAKKDFEYFTTLVEMALVHYMPEADELQKHITN
jgi:MarR-like DNA-binding transcriptional regulator SgrR of sgrS sRNA